MITAVKTNGAHDIVVDCNYTLKWNGNSNVYEDELKLKKERYKVFAKKGLIIRGKPAGSPIEKFEYGIEISKAIFEKQKNKYWERLF